MSDFQNQRYYYIQLPKNFFKSHPLDVLRAMDGGREALLLYVELLAESTGHDGHLLFSDNKPFTTELIAAKFQTDIKVVEKSIALLKEFELLEVLENNELYLPKFAEYVGSRTNGADYKANKRAMSSVREDKKRTKRGQTEDKERTKKENFLKSIEYRDKSIEIKKERVEKENSTTTAAVGDLNAFATDKDVEIKVKQLNASGRVQVTDSQLEDLKRYVALRNLDDNLAKRIRRNQLHTTITCWIRIEEEKKAKENDGKLKGNDQAMTVDTRAHAERNRRLDWYEEGLSIGYKFKRSELVEKGFTEEEMKLLEYTED